MSVSLGLRSLFYDEAVGLGTCPIVYVEISTENGNFDGAEVA